MERILKTETNTNKWFTDDTASCAYEMSFWYGMNARNADKQ